VHAAGGTVARTVAGHGANLAGLEHRLGRAGSTRVFHLNKGLITLGGFVDRGARPLFGPRGVIRIDHIEVSIHDRNTVGQPVGQLPQGFQASC